MSYTGSPTALYRVGWSVTTIIIHCTEEDYSYQTASVCMHIYLHSKCIEMLLLWERKQSPIFSLKAIWDNSLVHSMSSCSDN